MVFDRVLSELPLRGLVNEIPDQAEASSERERNLTLAVIGLLAEISAHLSAATGLIIGIMSPVPPLFFSFPSYFDSFWNRFVASNF